MLEQSLENIAAKIEKLTTYNDKLESQNEEVKLSIYVDQSTGSSIKRIKCSTHSCYEGISELDGRITTQMP